MIALRRTLARVPPLETAVLVIAIAVLTGVLYSQQQGAPPNYDSFSTYDASAGGYRALYELAEREGMTVDRFERRSVFLDASMKTLVYAEPLAYDERSGPTGENEARNLEAWVRSGGRFVYFGYDDTAAKLKLFNLPHTRPLAKAAHAPRFDPALAAGGIARLGRVAARVRWKLPAHPPSGFRMLFDDGRGAVAVTYPFGKGAVTAVIDESLLDDESIATYDRARFAMTLLQPGAPAGTIWFDETPHGYLVPEHWYEIVPRPFVYATIAAALACLVALFGAAVRFGPAIVPERVDDRTSADFIDALSTLLERGKAGSKALADAVRSTSRAVARSAGLSGDPSNEEIAARIPDQERRTDFETMLTLANDPKLSGDAFVRAIAIAQRLRKDAVSHGR